MPTGTARFHRVLRAPPRRIYRAFLDPAEKLVYTDRFDDPNLPGVMTTTVLLKAVSCGTEVSIVQEGIPGLIPTEMCVLGWQESLLMLAQLVEAEICE